MKNSEKNMMQKVGINSTNWSWTKRKQNWIYKRNDIREKEIEDQKKEEKESHGFLVDFKNKQ